MHRGARLGPEPSLDPPHQRASEAGQPDGGPRDRLDVVANAPGPGVDPPPYSAVAEVPLHALLPGFRLCAQRRRRTQQESLDADRIIFTPDQYLGAWVAGQTDKEIILWEGACEVHERFTGQELAKMRADNPGLRIIAHPECPGDVLEEADYVGSTAGMSNWIRDEQPAKVAMVTECSMADNVAQLAPETEFVRPCNMCPHMKRITVHNIRTALENLEVEVHVDPSEIEGARRALEAMLAVG